jgi:hypothetical protein
MSFKSSISGKMNKKTKQGSELTPMACTSLKKDGSDLSRNIKKINMYIEENLLIIPLSSTYSKYPIRFQDEC